MAAEQAGQKQACPMLLLNLSGFARVLFRFFCALSSMELSSGHFPEIASA